MCLGRALVLLRECCKCTADLKNVVGAYSFYCCGGLDVTYMGGKIIWNCLFREVVQGILHCALLGMLNSWGEAPREDKHCSVVGWDSYRVHCVECQIPAF